jgi:uncharacterized protein YggE
VPAPDAERRARVARSVPGMEREVIVRGSAEVRIPPDRALVHVTLDADGGSRDDAYRGAARTAAAVDAIFEQHASETDRIVTTALAVQPLTRWRKGELIRTGWRATRRSTVEVVEFGGLGALLADLVGAGATIGGPDWVVDDTNDAVDRVRVLAAEDARRRAEAYVGGLGIALGSIRWIAEPGLRTTSTEPPVVRMQMAAAGGARAFAVEEEPVIEVEPADSIIAASVEVSFDLA